MSQKNKPVMKKNQIKPPAAPGSTAAKVKARAKPTASAVKKLPVAPKATAAAAAPKAPESHSYELPLKHDAESASTSLSPVTDAIPKKNFFKHIVSKFYTPRSHSERIIEEIKTEAPLDSGSDDPDTDASSAPARSDVTSSSSIDIDRLKATTRALVESRKATNERFLHLAEEIGGIRQSLITQERESKELANKVTKAIDLVDKVQPQALYSEARRLESRFIKYDSRLESDKELVEKTLNEVHELRSKVNSFRGAEDLLKLHDDITHKLTEIQHIAEMAQKHADKVENVFMAVEQKATAIEAAQELAKTLKQTHDAIQLDYDKLHTRVSALAEKKDVQEMHAELGEVMEIQASTVAGFKEQLARMKDEIKTASVHSDASASNSDAFVDRFAALEHTVDDVRSMTTALRAEISTVRAEGMHAKDIDALMTRLALIESKIADVNAAQTSMNKQIEMSANAHAESIAASQVETRLDAQIESLAETESATEAQSVVETTKSYEGMDGISVLASYIDEHLSALSDEDVHKFLEGYGYDVHTVNAALSRLIRN